MVMSTSELDAIKKELLDNPSKLSSEELCASLIFAVYGGKDVREDELLDTFENLTQDEVKVELLFAMADHEFTIENKELLEYIRNMAIRGEPYFSYLAAYTIASCNPEDGECLLRELEEKESKSPDRYLRASIRGIRRVFDQDF
jgi:hypothetical protein